MHNFNLTSTPTASQSATNLSILEESCNNNSYSYWVDANGITDAALASSALLIAPTSTDPSSWTLTNGVTSGVCFYVRRHNDWKYGSFDLNVHWSTNANSGNVLFSATAAPITHQTAFPTPSACNFTVAVGDRLFPTLNLLSSAALRQASLIERSKMGIYVILSRIGGDAADTNTGDVSIYGIELIYNESKRVIGDAIKK